MGYDTVIVSGEPAGYTAAERAATGDLKTVLFEKRAIGGICLNEGCIPIRTLSYSAKLWDAMKGVARYGIAVPDAPVFDMGKTIDRKDKVVEELAGGVKMTVGSHGVAVAEKEAVIAGEENGMSRIVVSGETYEAACLLMCTGPDTVIPPIPGLSDTDYWTSKEASESRKLPRSLVIIGGGVIGMEFASFFSSMRVRVSVVEMMPEILGAMDKETAGTLRSEYLKCGVNFYLGTKVTAVSREGMAVEKDGKAPLIKAGKILVSVGREANLDQVGLDRLNVELLRNGTKADEHMQTPHPRAYACDDITGCSMLAHTVIRGSEATVNHILGMEDAMNYDCIPGVVYTNPGVAGVEKTEGELKILGTGYHIQELPMVYSGRFVAENELDNGLCKLALDDGDRIIGYHLLGDPASEIIVAMGIAVQHGYTVEEFQKNIFPYPTVGEIFHEALFA